MAAPDEGTYVIIATHSQKAVEVANASDANTENVRQYARNDSDAQLWTFVQMSDGYWQVFSSLTGRCLEIANNRLVDGNNVRQYSDNNSDAQRWTIQDTGETFTYQNTSYNVYRFSAKSNSNFVMDVNGISTSDGANIMIHTWNGGSNQKWILVPKPVLTELGGYQIIPATDESLCMGIAASSTANGSKIQLEKRSESINHTFVVERQVEQNILRIVNANSQKAISTKTTNKSGQHVANDQIIQASGNITSEYQRWMLVQIGNMKVDGSTVPTYQFRQVAGSGVPYGIVIKNNTTLVNDPLTVSSSTTPTGPATERFAFIKTDIPANNISAPGKLSPTSFTRDGLGTINVTGLKMQTKEQKFQARYMVRSYSDTGRTTYTDSAWKNLHDDSTARSGWGYGGTETFTATPKDGYVTIPFDKNFEFTSEIPFIDIFIQIRVFKPTYISSLAFSSAHGTSAQTQIRLIQNPTITLKSFGFDRSDDGNPVLKFSLNSSFATCQSVRACIFLKDGTAVSEWKKSSDFDVLFDLANDILDLPASGTELLVKYELITDQGSLVSGSSDITLSYSDGNPITITYSEDDSATAIASASVDANARCYVLVDYSDKTRYIECDKISYDEGIKTWRILPSLNKNCEVLVVGTPTENTYSVSKTTCRIDSHLYLWNWTSLGSEQPYNVYSGVLINPDKPPTQTRSFTTDIQFLNPTGRYYPVAFSGRVINASFNVDGIVLDDGANYISSLRMPDGIKLSDLKRLISLSGAGIHPVYRSPYGDWAFVGIESVDLSKSEIGYSTASITQRAVED